MFNFLKRNLTHKILPFFALFIFFILLTTNVKATDEAGGSGSMGGRDDVSYEDGNYYIYYDYYDSKGHKTGTVKLSESSYNNSHWVLFSDEHGNIYYYSNSTGNFYFNYFTDENNYILFCNNPGAWENNYYSKYNSSTQTFSSVQCRKYNFMTNHWDSSKNYIFNPSGIIMTKGMSVYYHSSNSYEYYHYAVPVDFPIIYNYSEVYSGSYEYIDILLNDCYDFGLLEDTLADGKNIKRTYKVNKFAVKFYNVETGDSIFTQTYSSMNKDDASGFYMYIDNDEFYHLRFPRELVYDEIVEKGKEYAISLSFDFSVTTNIDDKFYTFTQRYSDEDVYQFVYGTPVEVPDDSNDPTNNIVNSFTNSIGEQTGAINNQTNAIKEQTEVNKNIFEKIGEMLSYINPFSENFFVYKLIELLIEMLKGMFIPSNEFFENYFSELNNWFSDRFGFLYYPLDLFFDLTDRFLHINFSEPIIDIPDIYEPTTNNIFIHATKFNFNTLLEQNSLKTVHDIYLIIVDAIIYVGLVILLYNKYEEVMTK